MKVLKITVNKKYKRDEEPSHEEIYEIGRQDLHVDGNQRQVEYAFIFAYCERWLSQPSQFRGKSLALYKIQKWERDGTGKWRFSGELADESLRKGCIHQYEASRERLKKKNNSAQIINLDVFKNFGHGIEQRHVKSALHYIATKGKNDVRGIYYAFAKPLTTYILHGDKKCGIKEVIRIAYCYSIDKKPKGENGTFLKGQYDLFNHNSKGWNTNKGTKFLVDWGFKVYNGNSHSKRNATRKLQN